MIKIYFIIASFNGEKYITKCIKSILANGVPENRIIVIDNGSVDLTKNIIKNIFPEITLIENNLNYGFGKANNIGINIAYNNGATHFFLLNQDVYLNHDSVNLLAMAAVRNPSYAIVSPIHLNQTGTGLDVNFQYYISNNYTFWNNILFKYEMPEILESKFVNAACWLISKNCINQVGGFDEIFFHYGEDEDYVKRVFYKKMKIGFCPKAIIIHDRDNSQLNNYNKFDQLFIRTKIQLKDLEISYIKLIRAVTYAQIIFVIHNLFLLRISDVFIHFKLLFKIILNIKSIYVSREKSRQIKSFLKI